MGLKLHGKAFELTPPSPTVARVMAFLDKQKDDELLETPDLMAAVKVSIHVLNKYSLDLAAYHEIGSGRSRGRYWGNKKAIAELRRLKAEAGCR